MIESAGLAATVLKAFGDIPPVLRRKRGIRWVSGPEWKEEMYLLKGPDGEYLVQDVAPGGRDYCPECGNITGRTYLLGIPVKFCKDGGVPHIAQG